MGKIKRYICSHISHGGGGVFWPMRAAPVMAFYRNLGKRESNE